MGDAVGNRSRRRPRRGVLLLVLALLALTGLLAAGPDPGAPDIARAHLSGYPWVYLRDGSPPAETAPGDGLVTLIAVGDVMPGRGVLAEAHPLAAARPWLQAADLTLGNLEAALSPSGVRAGGPPALRTGRLPQRPGNPERILLTAPITTAAQLRAAGFDLLSLANNHSLDCGPQGLAETMTQLETSGITPLGAGVGVESYEPVVREIRGVRLAFLAFNAVPDPEHAPGPSDWQPARWEREQAVAAVQAARADADAVVVSLHWGHEYELRAAPWQREAAQALVAAGADLVLGHHPHVVQEIAAFPEQQALAAYSLGNFLFDQSGPDVSQGLALRAFFDRDGLVAVQALPLHAGLQPRLMDAAAAASLLARITPPAPRVAFACDGGGCRSLGSAPQEAEEGEGLFWSGAIDLTGDGEPELVRRAAQQVTIYEGGEAVWQSAPEWRVVDAALGDPNDDGRGELVLALWQQDAAGYERSQPYIVGHRSGAYSVIWGGRPVASPILELALGDVDGDGAQELVALEQAGEHTRLAVWRWQGWTFSLFWRSGPGPYSDLRLARGDDGEWLATVVRSDGASARQQTPD